MFKCPHCQHKSITFSQKLNLVLNTKNRDYRCKKCGGLVAVSFGLTILFTLLISILLMCIYFNLNKLLRSSLGGSIIIFFGTISSITFLVPLKKLREHTKY